MIKLSSNIPPSLNPNFKLSTANRLSYAGGHGNIEKERLLNHSTTSGGGRRNNQRGGSNGKGSNRKNVSEGDSDDREAFVSSIGGEFEVLKGRVDDESLSRGVSEIGFGFWWGAVDIFKDIVFKTV